MENDGNRIEEKQREERFLDGEAERQAYPTRWW
jgi:hypothetical protein